MTVAAMTAVALDQILTEQRKRSGADLFGPARQLQRQVARPTPASLFRPRVLLPVLARHRPHPLTSPPTTSKPDPAST